MEPIYTVKKPCPRNLGTFFCDECKAAYLEESSNVDYPIGPMTGCGKVVDNRHRCGFTHLGYKWCDDCVAKNRAECGHFGEFEIVAIIHEYPD